LIPAIGYDFSALLQLAQSLKISLL